MQGYCNFLPEEKLLQAVEVGQVVYAPAAKFIACEYLVSFFVTEHCLCFSVFMMKTFHVVSLKEWAHILLSLFSSACVIYPVDDQIMFRNPKMHLS